MIKICRDYYSPPGFLESRDFKKLIQEILVEKNKHHFKMHYEFIVQYRKELESMYRDKCGYCESSKGTEGYLTIDHYRPKKEVKGEKLHPGYYWLGYEWTNFVIACPKCNSYKYSHFPIDETRGTRRMKPPMRNGELDLELCHVNSKTLRAEWALILHPEMDNPEEHLMFLENGEVTGITEKGKKTIEICQLNRDTLVTERRRLIDKFYRQILTILHRKFIEESIGEDVLEYELDEIFNRINQAGKPHKPYSRLGWYLFEYFETFFIGSLEAEFGKDVVQSIKDAFSNFKTYGTCRKVNTRV